MNASWPESSRSSSQTNALFWAVNTAIIVALLAVMVRPGIRLDWFFDESWRVDMIRSTWSFDRYFQHNTPLPPGWIVLNWLVFGLLPQTNEFLRAVAVAPAIPAWLLIADVLRRRFTPLFNSAINGALLATFTIFVALLLPTQAQIVTYLNNYSFELMLAAALIWAAERIDRGEYRYSIAIVITIAVIGPFISLAPLFLLGPVMLLALVSVRGHHRIWIATAAGFGGTVLALTYVIFLRPVSKREIYEAASISEFWAGDSMTSLDSREAARYWAASVRNALIPFDERSNLLMLTLIAIFGAVGAILMWRAFRFWIIAAISTQVIIIAASFAVNWAIGIGRLNTAVNFLIVLLFPLGLAASVICCASSAAQRFLMNKRDISLATAGATLSAALLVAVSIWPTEVQINAANNIVFARGITGDLSKVAEAAEPEDVVLGFHWMSSWYINDRLITDGDVPVIVLDELRYGQRVVDEPEALIDAVAPDARRIWCVRPYELGPEGVERRCNLSDSVWRLESSSREVRVELSLWVRE